MGASWGSRSLGTCLSGICLAEPFLYIPYLSLLLSPLLPGRHEASCSAHHDEEKALNS